jgi:hypothetical protein
MNLRRRRAAGRACELGLLALDVEIDAVPGGVKPDIPHCPRRLQTCSAGEQGFDLNVHDFSRGSCPVDM